MTHTTHYKIVRIDEDRFGLSEHEDDEMIFYTIIQLCEIGSMTANYAKAGIMGEIIF